jgi:predicted aspartyl protease
MAGPETMPGSVPRYPPSRGPWTGVADGVPSRADSPPRYSPSPSQPASDQSEIPLQKRGGDFVVPVVLNNALTLQFQIDSGSSDVSVSRDVMSRLLRSGTLDRSDFLGKQMYTLADGSTVANETFRIHVLRVGDREMRDVTCSVSSEDGGLLLGQSFLQRFKSWAIDNQRRMLVLN